jgi:hypothetical protein
MGQGISLMEVLTRRRAVGRPSFVTFIDLKAAFDTVPNQALFARLRAVGITGPNKSNVVNETSVSWWWT